MATYNFPSNVAGAQGAAVNDGGAGLSLGFLVTSTVAGITATGIRWYAPVAMTVTPYLWNAGTGAVLATGPAVACVVGWNTLPFTTPYAMAQNSDVIAGAFQSATQRYTAKSNVFPLSSAPFAAASGPSRYNYSTTPGLTATSGSSGNTWFGIDIVGTDGASAATTAIRKGVDTPSAIKRGTADVSAAYKGTTKVWGA